LRAIREKGWDIGLHGSYDSFIDEDMLKRQKVMLENALDSRITGVRQHYLRFSAQDTPPVQEKAGFLYDSTLGYNEDIGFRAGLAAPFFVYDNKNRKKSNILELPLAVMDGSLFLSRRYTNQEAFNKVKELIDGVEAVGGLIVFLWHNKARDTQDFPGWWETYLSILEYLHGRKAWMTNASQLAEWWVDRIKTCAV
jgi:peptidoglycan/xylan/chitin deacetylase (PgdA/CDA1 family)